MSTATGLADVFASIKATCATVEDYIFELERRMAEAREALSRASIEVNRLESTSAETAALALLSGKAPVPDEEAITAARGAMRNYEALVNQIAPELARARQEHRSELLVRLQKDGAALVAERDRHADAVVVIIRQAVNMLAQCGTPLDDIKRLVEATYPPPAMRETAGGFFHRLVEFRAESSRAAHVGPDAVIADRHMRLCVMDHIAPERTGELEVRIRRTLLPLVTESAPVQMGQRRAQPARPKP